MEVRILQMLNQEGCISFSRNTDCPFHIHFDGCLADWLAGCLFTCKHGPFYIQLDGWRFTPAGWLAGFVYWLSFGFVPLEFVLRFWGVVNGGRYQ